MKREQRQFKLNQKRQAKISTCISICPSIALSDSPPLYHLSCISLTSDELIGWLIDWLIDSLIDWLIDRLTGWLTNGITNGLIDWSIDWLVGWLLVLRFIFNLKRLTVLATWDTCMMDRGSSSFPHHPIDNRRILIKKMGSWRYWSGNIGGVKNGGGSDWNNCNSSEIYGSENDR